jgi:hypothetical protein
MKNSYQLISARLVPSVRLIDDEQAAVRILAILPEHKVLFERCKKIRVKARFWE